MNCSVSRVVSLVPCVTETLLAWGMTPIACTRYCEQPELTHVGGTKNPDIAAIVDLAPDLVVMDREESRLEDFQAIKMAGIDVEVLHVTSLADVAPELARLAARLDDAVVSSEVTASSVAEVAAASVEVVAAASVEVAAPSALTAFVPIWRKPWMTINHATYGASMLNRLGVQVVFADHPDRYPTVTAADITASAPNLVLAPTEPYPFAERHFAELGRFAPTHLIDGQDLFWWGARTPAALVRLATAINSISCQSP